MEIFGKVLRSLTVTTLKLLWQVLTGLPFKRKETLSCWGSLFLMSKMRWVEIKFNHTHVRILIKLESWNHPITWWLYYSVTTVRNAKSKLQISNLKFIIHNLNSSTHEFNSYESSNNIKRVAVNRKGNNSWRRISTTFCCSSLKIDQWWKWCKNSSQLSSFKVKLYTLNVARARNLSTYS